MKKQCFILLLAAAVLFSLPDAAPAQTETQQAEISQYIYTYGTVIALDEKQITLQEYDYDSDDEKEVTYLLDPAIVLEGAGTMAEIAVDDAVELYYEEQDGKKTARVIRKEVIEEDGSSDGDPSAPQEP